VAAAQIGTVETSPVLEQLGIVLIQIKEGVGAAAFSQGVESLSESQPVESETPVYAVGGVDQVLVNEFIVQFASDATDAEMEAVLGAANAEVVSVSEKIPNRYVIRFPGQTAREALDLSNSLSEHDRVDFSEPNFVVIVPARPRLEEGAAAPSAPSMPSPEEAAPDPLFSNQWYLNNTGAGAGVADADVDAPEAWDKSHGNSSIIIAIIDEGVQTTHPDLQAKIETPYDATDGDNNQEPNSWDGHGTACAGIAAAVVNTQGVAGLGWDVHIMPIRIAYSNYSGGPWVTTYAWIEDGIRTAVDRGAHVLSNSWGGGNSNLVNTAIDYAIANNRIVVFAAGNDAGPVGWPANLSDTKVLIAVSATNEWDQFKTTTSSDGENWWGSNFGPEINISAPGVHMYTTDITGGDGYAAGDYVSNFNGTSSATPLVAGAAALVRAENPGWTPTQVRNKLQSSADDLGASGRDDQFGHGRLNACKALDGACDGDGQNCSTIAPVSALGGGPGAGQTLVNLALVLSSLFLLLLLPLLRRVAPPA
jgi:subtilisin family serine protease